MAEKSILRLQKDQFFASHGISDLNDVPQSLKYLHKVIACNCLAAMGVQLGGFDTGIVCKHFRDKDAEERAEYAR